MRYNRNHEPDSQTKKIIKRGLGLTLGHSVPLRTDKEQKENNLNLVVREKNLTFTYSDQTKTDKHLLQLTGPKRSITLSVIVCTLIQRKKPL